MDLSPDEHHVAVSRVTPTPSGWPQADLWLIDIARSGVATRLTDDLGQDWDPAWSPTGSRIAFNHVNSIREDFGLYLRPSEASGNSTLLLSFGNITGPDWSHNERFIVFTESASGQADLWVVPTEGEHKPIAFSTTRHDERAGVFSPNDRWIAYESNASGRLEVYLRPFPIRPGETVVSSEGGRAPRWRGDGKEIFFLSVDRRMMAAVIDPITGRRICSSEAFLSPHTLGRRSTLCSHKRRATIPDTDSGTRGADRCPSELACERRAMTAAVPCGYEPATRPQTQLAERRSRELKRQATLSGPSSHAVRDIADFSHKER